jgi:hypothetical protein
MGVIDVSQVRNGQVVRFDYHGGERDGYRLVEVQKNEKGSIGGIDRIKGEYRQYRHDRIDSAISLVANVNEEIVNPSVFLVDTSVPIDKAADVYRMLNPERADSVRVDQDANVLVVRRKDLPRIDVDLTSATLTIEFTSVNGERVGIRMNHQNSGVVPATYTSSPSAPDFAYFVQTLYDQHKGNISNSGKPPTMFTVDSKGEVTTPAPTRWEDMLKNRALVGINKQI